MASLGTDRRLPAGAGDQTRPGALLLLSTTRETLERISGSFQPAVEIEIGEDLYAASASDLLARLREVGSHVESLMVIGHGPAIPDLARNLAGRGAEIERLQGKFPTAGLATLAFDGSWQKLAPGSAELVDFVKPRELADSGHG